MMLLMFSWQVGQPLTAATLYWDADGVLPGNSLTTGAGLGGSGIWNTSLPYWWDGNVTEASATFTSGDTAVFMGLGGVVQLGSPVTLGSLTFGQSVGASGFNITGDGTAGSNTLTLAGAASIAVNAAGADTISAVIAGSSGLNLSSTTTGTLVLSGANTFSGNINISSGTLGIFADANLGNAANDITFNGSLAAGLMFNAPVTLGAGRTITLGNTGGAVALLSSNGAAAQVVLGQVTGAGTLAVANAGTTYLLNTGNNNTGILWAQSGTVSLSTLLDGAGNGNVRLGSAGTTGGLQWNVGATGALTLNNRSIELAGTTGGGTIDSASLVAANSITINSNLVASGSGAKTLTLTGFNTGINTFAGQIVNNTTTTGVNKTGMGLWVLTNANNTYTGATTATAGTLRINGAGALSASSAIAFAGGQLELRSDTSKTWGNVSGITATSTLFIDHTLGGTAAGQTITLGTFAANGTFALNIVGDHGYNLTTGLMTVTGAKTVTLNNYLGAPGYTAAGYSPGTITIGNGTNAITTVTTGTAALVLAGYGDYVFAGDIKTSSAANIPLNITKSNLGVVVFSGNNSSWSSTTQGILNTTAGTTRINGSTSSIGGSTIGVAGGMTEVRNNASTSWSANNLTLQTASGTFVAAPQIGSSNTGNLLTLGSLTSLTTGLTFSFDTNHSYGITFSGAGTTAIAATTLSNIGNGTITYAGGLTNTAAATWTIAGNGDSVISGSLTEGTGALALTKTGLGTLTLSGAANSFNGTLTLTAGILKLTTALGTGTGNLTFNNTGSGLPNNNVIGLDLRNNGSLDFSTHGLGRSITTVFNVDNNGSGTNGTMTLGGGLSLQDSGWSDLFMGANGYSLKFGASSAVKVGIGSQTGALSYTLWNYVPSISGNGNVELAGGLTFFNPSTQTAAIVLGGTGDYKISGAITYTAAGTSADTITKSGLGTVTLTADSSSTWNTGSTVNIYTMTNGITRTTVAGALGGANAKVNVNSGVLDLRGDTGFTLTAPITLGASNSYINADRAVGGAGTGQTMTLNGVSSGAFTSYFTSDNNYSINTGTFTQTGASVLVNRIGGTGALIIPTLTGTFNAKVDGTGSTGITTALTLATGTLTKSGTGTLTVGGPAAYAASNTNGAVTVNGGTLALDFTGISTATNLLQSAALTLGAGSAGAVSGGALSIKGAATGNTSQTLSTLAVQAGYDQIVLTPNGAGTTTLAFTGAITATNAGGQLLISAPTNATVTIGSALNTAATTGRNVVFYDGSSYNWATNAASGGATISVTNGSALAAVKYAALALTAGTDTSNSQIATNALTTLGGARTTNSLMISPGGAGGSLALGANTLTLTQGGILFTGSNAYTITGTSASSGLKSATATNSDLVINNYSSSTLSIQAPIIQGTGISTLTIGGLSTGTTVLGNSSLLATVGTYTGITYINSGTVQLASGITGFGAAASNTALTQNGGTLDLNGNNVNVGAFNGGPAAIIDNTNAGTASLTIGAGNGAGTFTGTIKNTGGALSLIKTGTGAITLGDLTGAGSLAFTGDLTINTAGASGANVLTLALALADTAGTKINLGTATAGDTVQMTYAGATNMILNNRQFNLSGQSSATITASGVNGINGTPGMLVINSNLLMDGTGAKTLTLGGTAGATAPGGGTVSGITGSGSVATINQFNGNIGNASGGGALTLTIAGSGGWSLGGNNSFTGGMNITSTGIIRGTSANAFGGSANTINWTAAGQLDLRSDSSLNFGNAITWGNAALKINVDRAINGTGYGQVMTLGAITETVSGQTLTVTNALGVGSNLNGTNPITGYGLRVAGLILNAGTATTITNGIGASSVAQFAVPNAGTGTAGAFTIDGISTAGSLGAHTLTIGSAGNAQSVTIITGDIVQGAGTTLGILYTGNNLMTLAGQTASTNYSGGLTFNNAATAASDANSAMTVRVTTQYALGSGAVTFSGNNFGTLEVRNDSSVTYANSFIINNATAANNRLYVGEAINGSGGHGNLFTFGQLTFQGITANALTIGGISNSNNNSGDSVTFGGVSLNLAGAATFTVTNNLLLPGMLNLGNVTSTNTTAATTQTLTIAGSGVTVLGNVTDSATATALTAITYSGTGILDLSGATSANTFSGGLSLNNGVTRVTNAYGLGASTNTVVFNGGTLELRSDSNVTYNNPLQLLATGAAPAQGSGINVGQLPGGTGVNGSSTPVTFTLAQLKVTAAGKTIAINGIGGVASSSASVASSAASVVFSGGIDLNGSIGGATTITNNLALPGIVDLGSVSSSTTGAATLTVNGAGFTTVGDVSNGSGTVTLTYGGTGILQVTPTATTTTNYSGGLNLSGSGTLRIITNGTAANFGATTNTIALTNGTLDIRTDSNLSVVNPITVATNSPTINVDAATSGNLSRTVTFGGAVTTLTTTAKTLTLTSGSNYGMTFTNGFSVVTSGATYTIANNASGTVNLGAIDFQAGTGALTLSGSGTTIVGNVTGTAAAPTLTYAGTGFLDMTGITGGTNPFSALTLSGAGGIARVNTVTNLGAAGSALTFTSTTTAATLQIRNDNGGTSNGTITFGNNVALNANNALGIIDLGNAGVLAATGNTVAFGALTNSTTANSIGTLTINGANGYGASFTSIALSSGTTGVATTLVANVPVAITGGVSNAMTVTAGKGNTLVLDGVSTGSISGSIADAAGGSLAAGGYTAITKQGTGTWTLSGANTNEGATTINSGTLLINGSSAANNAYTVNGGATQGLQGTLGGTGTIGGSVTLATNGATSFAQGAVLNPGTAGTVGTLTINGTLTTGNFSSLNFDLGGSTTPGGGVNDLIITSLLPNLGANTQININTLATLAVGSYTLINGYTGTLTLSNLILGNFTGVDTIHSGALQVSDGMLQLLVTAAAPATAYWSGAINNTWNTFGSGVTTNWRTDATGNVDTNALPDDGTDVHFYTTNPSVPLGPVDTILGSSIGIRTLSFDASSVNAVSISGSVLTITPTSSSTGISIDAAAGAVTINSALTLGAAQTWANNSTSNLFTVTGNVTNGGNSLTIAGAGNTTISTGVISGTGGLTKSGIGTLTLGAASTYGGATILSGGTLRLLTVTNALPTTTGLTLSGTATLIVDGAQTLSGAYGDTATNTLNGSAVLTFNSGAITINSLIAGSAGFGISQTGTGTISLTNASSTSLGTLNVTAATASTSTIDIGSNTFAASGITLGGLAATSAPVIAGSGGTLNLGGNVTYTATNNPLGGLISVANLNLQGAQRTFTVGDSTTAAADLTISSILSNGSLTKAGAGTLVLSGTNTYTGLTTISAGTLQLGIGGTVGSLDPTGGIANSGTLTLNRSNTITQSTGFGNISGTGSVIMNGGGTLVLDGTNTYTGNTTVNASTLNLTGSWTGSASTSALKYGDSAGISIVNLSGTYSGFIMTGANAVGSVAVMNQTAGTVTIVPTNGTDTQWVAKTGYGYLNITGGNFNTGRFDVNAPGGSAVGVLYVGGTGTLTQNTGDYFIIAYAGLAQMTVGPGGSFIRTSGASNNFQITMQNANSSGTLNIAGGTVNTGPAKGITFGFSSPGTGISGFVNLAAGTLAVGANTALVGTTGATSEYFNFTGGTLKANAALTNVIPASTANHTVVSNIFGAINNFAATGDASQNFTGGLKVDTNSFAVTFSNVLQGATGSGVAQSSLTVTGGTGYVGAPAVEFTGGTLVAGGTPASGYALISGGQVTGIVITNPGTYTVAPTVTLSGGGGTGASVAVGTLVANTSGGLTKIGTGTLTLSGANTFTGGIDIQGGLLSVATLTNGGVNGTLGASSNSAANLLLGSTTAGGGILQYTGTTAGTTDRNFTLNNVSGGFDASGTAAGTLTLTASNAMTVTGGLGNAFLYLQGSGTGTAGAGSIGTLLADGTGTTVGLVKQGTGTWAVTNTNTYSGSTTLTAGTLVVTSLANGGVGSNIGAATNAAGNLVFNGGTFQYTGGDTSTDRLFSVGGSFSLDGSGTGAVSFTNTGAYAMSGTASARTMTLTGTSTGSNTLYGSIADSGTGANITSLTKSGAGRWILAGANTYSGTTTISAGILQINGAAALSSSTAISLSGGTFSYRDDTAGAIDRTATNLTLATSGSTIDVGNNGGVTTGSVVRFGALNQLSAAVRTLNFTGSNGYTVELASLALSPGTGQTTTLNPTTTSVSIVGNVTNGMSGFTSAQFDTIVLSGSSTGNSIGGVISDAVGGSATAGGFTRITQNGGGSWRLSGQSTSTGAVAVQNGTLWLAGGDNRLNSNVVSVTLGTGTTSGKIVIGGNADGTTTAGSQRSQTFNQTTSTNILSTSGTGTSNSIVGGADGGTSAGSPVNNSTLTLNIGAGLTDTYSGLIGWDGTGSVGFQNNINLVKSGAGTLILTGDLSNWTGTQTNAAEGTDLTIDPTRPTITISGGVLRATGVLNTVVLQTGGIFDDQTTSHGVNFYLKITGGLVTSNALTDNAEDVVEAISHGVYALNFNNTGTTGVSGSDMYLGAVGARIFSGSALAAGSGSTYRFGGGAPWAAVSTATLGGSGGYLQIATANVITGANNVIIGDNGSYGSGLGIYGGNSTVEFTAAQNYTGTTTLAGGTLVVSNFSQLGSPTTAAGSIILDGGILRYSGALTTDVSNRITIASGGGVDTNGQSVTFATALGNSNTGTSGLSNGGLTKIGLGTLTLTAASTYTGTTTVNGGTLKLNRQTGSLASGSALSFGGNGTFNMDNTGASGTLSQTFGTLTFGVGDGVVLSTRTAAQSTTLTFAALPTRTAGATGNFAVAGTGSSASVNKVILTSAPTAGQFLNAGLYFGGVDFAVYDATGYVRAINYSTDTNVATSAGGATLGASVAGKDIQLNTAAVTAQTTVSINSLKIAGAFGITLGSGQTLTIASGGLIKTGTTATITGGTVATSGELVIRQDASADALTIASVITSGTGVAGNVALTKSGLGTLTLSTSTNTINGQIVINGGTITVDSVNRIAGSSGITLNGGGFTISGNSTINRVFTLGLNGGTITQSSTGQDNTIGTAGDVLQLAGMGARTLTLVGADARVKIFTFSIGDNGGATSLILSGSGDSSVYRLSGTNTYTGTTTINRGVLRVNAQTDLGGGVGGATPNSTNTGGGNLIFAATGTQRAILEINSTVGGVYRSVGTGFDQIQWTGNGGFSNQTANTTAVVNLGGAGATLTWGAASFVPAASRLQLGQGGANVAAAGTVDFQNSIDFGTAVRTLDIGNGSAIVDAILSGNLIFGSGGGFTMTTGIGALSLTGTNNTGVVPVTVSGGMLYFASANAVLGASGTITVTHGASAPAAIGMAGSTNPLLFWNSRLASSSNGAFALDVNSSDNLDFSVGNVTNMRLTAFNPANKAVYYTGTLTPNGSTYRFGGVAPVISTNAPSTTLVLSGKNTLTGARSVDLAPGNLTVTATQNYSGGTGVNTTLAGSTSVVGVGSDAAFGTGTITVGGANTVTFGAVNGDRVVANRILDTQTGTVAFVVSGDQTSDGIANNTNQGAITYAGTLDLNARAASAVLHIRTSHAAIFLGNITNSTNGITLNSSTASLFSILSAAGNGGVAKTFSGAVTLGDSTTLTIDGDSSLGTNGGLTMGSSTLILQPGTSGAIVLAGASTRTLTVTADKSPNFVVGAGGTLVITGAINGGTNTAARTFTKFGAGTLTLRGANGTYTGATGGFANTMQLNGGKLQLDSVNFTAATDRFIAETTLMPLTFGAGSATLGGGGTLEIVHDAAKAFALTQAFGNLTINQGAHTIALTNNNATQALNLNLGNVFTRAALNGGTLNFTSTTAGGANTIISTIANNSGGIIGGYATFNGLDWAVQSGSNSIIALAAGSYTTLTAAANSTTGNFILSSGSVTLSTSGASFNTLKLVGSSGGTNLTLNGTNALTSGGVIFDNTLGSATISGGTQLGATGSEIIVFTGGTGNNSTNRLTLNAVVKGTATALTKSGAGTLVLAGTNSYTGSLIINAGTVEYSNGSATGQNLGTPTAGATNIILNGGVLRQTATNNLIFGITVNGPAAIDLASGVTLTQTAQGITGISSATGLNTGLLQKTGLGTLTLAGTTANSNLSIEVVGGVLNLGKSSVLALGEATNGNGVPYAALIVGSGAVANLTGAGGNQIGDASSVVVRSGGIFDVMGTGATATAESFDGLAGTGTVRNTVGTLFTLTLGSNNSSNLAPYTLGAAAAGVSSTGLNNFGGVIQGNISLNKIGSGTQILSGNNTYSGSTIINEGTLKLGTTNALPSGAGKGDVTLVGDSTATGVAIGGSATVLAPGTLDLGGYNQAINGLNSTTGGYVISTPGAGANTSNTLTVGNGDANGAFNGVIADGYAVGADSTTAAPLAYAGVINFTKTGTGTQVLSGANTASGLLTVNQGEVDLNATAANAWSGNVIVNTTGVLKLLQSSQILDSMTLTVAGGTFRLNGYTETVAGVSLTGGGFILDIVGGGALTSTTTFDLQSGTVSGVLAGSVGVSKTTGGTVILSGANTFTGKTSVTGGVLSISADNNLGAAPGSNVDDQLTLDGGTLQTTASLVIASTRRITVGVSGGTFDTAAATTTTVNSVILGSGPITKVGAGTLIFTAVNTYSGKTSIQEGTLSVASLNSVATPAQSAGSSLGTPSNAANGTIDMGSGSTAGALVYTGTGETTDRVVNLAGTTGGATLDQSGTGAVKFTSDFTATGAGSKVLTLQGSTTGTGEISGAIVDNSGTNTTSVVKAGSGTWVLSGANSYAGTTTVNGGTLVISGTQASTGATTVNGGTLQVGAGGTGSITASTVTVGNGGTLSGSGTIATSTIIGSGGVLAPGDGDPSTGNATLTFSAASNSLTVANTGSIHLSLTTADSTDTAFAAWFHANPSGTAADYVSSIGGIANTGAGTSWNDTHAGSHDFISAADTIVLGSSSTADQRVVVSLNNLSGVTYGSVFNVMDWSTLGVTHDDSALSAMGAFSVANNLQLQDLTSFSAGLAWDTSLFDSYGILVVVPEPGRLLLIMLGLLGLLLRRRRRLTA